MYTALDYPIKLTVYVKKANSWLLYFVMSSFICQELYFTPPFPCHHLLATASPLTSRCPSSISIWHDNQSQAAR